MNGIENFKLNIELFKLINYSRSNFLDTFFSYFYLLGKGYVAIPIALVITYLKRPKSIRLLVITLIILGIIVVTIKKLYPVPRPLKSLDKVYSIVEHYKVGSFPSGDAALSMAIAVFISHEFRKKIVYILALTYAILIGYERVYTGNHFPLDIVAGYIVAIVSFLLAKRIDKVWMRRKE